MLVALVATSQAYTYQFHHYTEVNGIPGSAVLGMDQDPQGRLWVATRTGIASFDGTRWETHGIDRGLPVAPHADVAVDHRGQVWALATNTPIRVSRLTGGRWQMLPKAPGMGWGFDAASMALGQDESGEVTIAVAAVGGFVTVWSGGRWRTVVLPAGTDADVYGLSWQGAILYLATSHGLFRDAALDGVTAAELISDLPVGAVYGAINNPDRDGMIVAGRGWIGELSDAGFVERAHLPGLLLMAPEAGVAVGVDGLGGVYLGDRFTVFHHHPLLGLESLSRSNGMVANGLTDVLVDRGGQIWLSSLRGVSKLANRRFRNLAGLDGLLDDEVSAVLTRRDGTVVLGHVGGVTILGETVERFILDRAGFPWGRAIDLEESPDGGVMVAMDKRGLAQLDRTGRVRWYGADEGLLGAVYAVNYDTDGVLWVGTSSGVFRLTRQGIERVPVKVDGAGPSIRRLFRASDGALLAASGRRGIFRFHSGGYDVWSGEEGGGLNSTYAVFEPSADRFWVGTAAGLARVVDGRIELTTAPEPVISRAVFAIVEDKGGRVWFGTDAGVYVLEDGNLRQFGVTDGLIGSETNRDALAVDRDGRVWIGTDRGVSVHDDRLVEIPESRIPLWIDTVEVNGISCPMEAPLDLPTETHELVIHFRAPGFADESRLRFQTLLEGFDEDWSHAEPVPSRSVRYTNLPPGRYQFKVRAVDVEGRTSVEVASPAILVMPPVHQRPWFLALAGLVALALMWLVFSLIQGHRYTRRLAADVRDRTVALSRSEAAVRAESQRLAAVLESISDGVLAVGADGIVTLGNSAAAEILGREQGTLPGSRLEELLPGMGDVARMAGSAGQESGPHFEFRITHADGAAIGLDCAVAPLSAAGSGGGLVLAFRDVTERRRAEMERIRVQKLESLGVLAGGIAHDFNNLLTVTLGSTSLLESGCRADQQQLIDQIRGATHRAQGLTSQLLTFARGGAPQKRLADLSVLLDDATTLALAGTNVSLEREIPADLRHAEVDPGQLEQVISNLLINARQAMARGGRVWVSARNVGERDLEIRIRDEGCGIGAEELDRIFEPYYTTKDNGTGLGLAISHSVVTRHDGTLSVRSQKGEGTEFSIRLPASDQRVQPAPPVIPRTVTGGGRILVLDDEPFVRDLLFQMLTRLGYEVETVADGADALEVHAAAREAGSPFDTLIMDLTIPGGMGGKETMEHLLQIDPHVRAIVSSGYSQDPVMADPTGYGFVATLGKPFDSRALEQVLQQVLG